MYIYTIFIHILSLSLSLFLSLSLSLSLSLFLWHNINRIFVCVSVCVCMCIYCIRIQEEMGIGAADIPRLMAAIQPLMFSGQEHQSIPQGGDTPEDHHSALQDHHDAPSSTLDAPGPRASGASQHEGHGSPEAELSPADIHRIAQVRAAKFTLNPTPGTLNVMFLYMYVCVYI